MNKIQAYNICIQQSQPYQKIYVLEFGDTVHKQDILN